MSPSKKPAKKAKAKVAKVEKVPEKKVEKREPLFIKKVILEDEPNPQLWSPMF